MIGIIDRFESEFAVVELENEKMINIKRTEIPKEAKEGYVLNIEEKITINYEETEKRKRKIDEITKDIWE